ncbi:hypothetical protein J2Y38_004629 [Flavobacterium sp. 2755]|nr:hypothetical protein [Flavobacterium sp. 2755]
MPRFCHKRREIKFFKTDLTFYDKIGGSSKVDLQTKKTEKGKVIFFGNNSTFMFLNLEFFKKNIELAMNDMMKRKLYKYSN